jgi:hypothetical protein
VSYPRHRAALPDDAQTFQPERHAAPEACCGAVAHAQQAQATIKVSGNAARKIMASPTLSRGVFGLRKGEKPGALFYRDDIARKGAALPKAKAAAITSLLVYSLM